MAKTERKKTSNPPPQPAPARNLIWLPALLLTLLAVWLHWVWLQHAGALWRDEAGFVRLATLQSWPDVWAMIPHDHSPILPLAALRGWLAVAGTSDAACRAWGFSVGLLVLGSFWAGRRIIRPGAPLVALVLIGVNAEAIRTTDALRGYGLGSALAILAVATIWRAIKHPGWFSILLATGTAILSVQSLFSNAFLLLAAGVGGAATCALRRDFKSMLRVLGVGAVAALCLIPYIPCVIEAQQWYVLEKAGFNLATAWANLSVVIGFPKPGMIWIWALLMLAVFVRFGLALVRWSRKRVLEEDDEIVVFSTITLFTGLAGFWFFLATADLPTQSWYYVSLLVFVALCLDVALPVWKAPASQTISLCVLGMLAIACVAGSSPLRVRQTNIDQLAQHLEQEARAGDLIIVHPWYCGVSFARYYHGPATWETLPALTDYRLHRYDLFKEKMQQEAPIRPILEQIAQTLKAGHRVWVAGNINLSGDKPPELPPAPKSEYGWADSPYSYVWGAQTGFLLVKHARAGSVVIDPSKSNDRINPFETIPLFEFTGWRDN